MTMRHSPNLMDQTRGEIRGRLHPGGVSRRLKNTSLSRSEEAKYVIDSIRSWVEEIAATELEAADDFNSDLYREAYFEANSWP